MSPRPLLLLALVAAAACSETELGDAATANIVDTVSLGARPAGSSVLMVMGGLLLKRR